MQNIPSVELGGLVIRKVMENLPLDEKEIDGVIMGLCLPGVGLSPARQAVLAAKFPVETNAFTVDRACCSALSAVGIGIQWILGEQASIMIAGGMENMSRTPYLIPQMRWGARCRPSHRIGNVGRYASRPLRSGFIIILWATFHVL